MKYLFIEGDGNNIDVCFIKMTSSIAILGRSMLFIVVNNKQLLRIRGSKYFRYVDYSDIMFIVMGPAGPMLYSGILSSILNE